MIQVRDDDEVIGYGKAKKKEEKKQRGIIKNKGNLLGKVDSSSTRLVGILTKQHLLETLITRSDIAKLFLPLVTSTRSSPLTRRLSTREIGITSSSVDLVVVSLTRNPVTDSVLLGTWIDDGVDNRIGHLVVRQKVRWTVKRD
jgi:hypothetical protein